MTTADDTERSRTRVATSAVYDTFVGISGVPVMGLTGEDMVKSNKEGRGQRQVDVVVQDHAALNLPRKVYTVGEEVDACGEDMCGQRNP